MLINAAFEFIMIVMIAPHTLCWVGKGLLGSNDFVSVSFSGLSQMLFLSAEVCLLWDHLRLGSTMRAVHSFCILTELAPEHGILGRA